VQKDKNKLNIVAVSYTDSILKRLEYSDVGPEFTITSQPGNIFVKSKKIWWNGINLMFNYQIYNVQSLKKFDKLIQLGISTDFNVGNKFNFGMEPLYDFSDKKIKFNLYTKLNLFQ
jgi:hypothetical protein